MPDHERTPKGGRNLSETAPTADIGHADVYLFLGWTLDLRRELLVKAGEEHRLRAKTYEVLVYLVRHPGRVVAKQELLDAVWGDVAVTEDSLVQCLMEIRRTLGDVQESLKTVRGRGYLLDAQVESRRASSSTVSVFPAASALRVARPTAEPPGDLSVATPVPRSQWILVAVALLVLLLGVGAWRIAASRGAVTRNVSSQITMSPDALQAFEEGRRLQADRGQVNMQRARQEFERAVVSDPGFALARAALADQLTMLSVFGAEQPADVMPRALDEAERAVEIDPTIALAWTALGHAIVQWSWDWPRAEAAYRRAIALDPRDAQAHFLLAHLLNGLRRQDEALAESLAARQLEPSSSRLIASNGIMLYWARQHEAAREAFQRAIEIDPKNANAHFWMALNDVSRGDLESAMQAALNARGNMSSPPTWIVGYVHGVAGRRAEGLEVLHALEAQASGAHAPAAELGLLNIGLGDHDAALRWLERALQERSGWMAIMAALPVTDPLRDQPRFKAILRTMHLPGGE